MAAIDDVPVFQGYDPHAPMRIYRRHLPHWRQDHATYFVTFRLGDSIPRQVLLRWQDEDRQWLKAHGIEGPMSDIRWRVVYDSLPEKERVAFERRAGHRLHVELDNCHGACLLRQPDMRERVVNAVKHFHGERWWVGDLVVMPNHVHGLFKPRAGHELEDVLGSVKGFCSHRLTKERFKSGSLWQQENHDRLVRDRKELAAWRRYISENPVKAGLRADEYTCHQCAWLDS